MLSQVRVGIGSVLKAIYHKLVPERARAKLMTIRLARYFEDGLITIHNCDFVGNPRFLRALALGEQTNSWKGWPIRWRAYVVCWCAEHASRLQGDFVECGVYKGGYARMIIDYADLAGSGKHMHLFDTFNGFVPDLLRPEETRTINLQRYSECLAEVKSTFAPFSFVNIMAGPVPYTLPEADIQKVCFLSIDMNCVEPEIAAAEYFWPKMVSGAVMVLDDYGQSAHIAQKLAFDDFAKAHGVSVLCLPTSQGLIFKP